MAYGKPGKEKPWLLPVVLGSIVVVVVGLLILRSGTGGDDDDCAAPLPVVNVPSTDGYADPPEDGVWKTKELDEETYTQATVESTCMSQRFNGPPGELSRELDRIYYHYKTTAQDIAAFATEINSDDARAIRVGEQIARSIEACPGG